jgi:glycosyltransferase involved in cell wall biosynthesis
MKRLSFGISVPVGSYHPFLPACLESLVRQKPTVKIALLDASGDPRVSALADRYADKLAYRHHGPDGGQADAIKEGWRHLEADILGWLNADDILFPDALERAMQRFAVRPEIDVVYGHSTILDPHGRMIGYHWSVEPPGPQILESGIISQPSCFFRRSAYDAAGGLDAGLHYTMDWDLWMRLYKGGANFDFIDEPLSLVMWGGDTKTASFNQQRQSELRQLIELHAPPEKRRKIFRSFAIHHQLDRIRPEAFRKFLFTILARRRKTIFGVAADGRIADTGVLWLVHYDALPHDGIALAFDGIENFDDASIAGRTVNWRRNGRTIDLTVDPPVGAGETVNLRITAKATGTLKLQSCAWAPT